MHEQDGTTSSALQVKEKTVAVTNDTPSIRDNVGERNARCEPLLEEHPGGRAPRRVARLRSLHFGCADGP
jgi:hypothetical protein